ncbi:MAG: PadR family transcriptional regulator [Propionibacteriaceae bacterium]|nr:PadR family transcriptional regulator [Propionibacteriaceae bacterium]
MDDLRILTNLRKGVLECCVLALMQDHDVYGVDLAKRLTALGLIASEGTLYPVLSRLRKTGLVSTRWEESTMGPPRRYYSITAEGRHVVEQFQHIWGSFSTSVEAALRGGGKDE